MGQTWGPKRDADGKADKRSPSRAFIHPWEDAKTQAVYERVRAGELAGKRNEAAIAELEGRVTPELARRLRVRFPARVPAWRIEEAAVEAFETLIVGQTALSSPQPQSLPSTNTEIPSTWREAWWYAFNAGLNDLRDHLRKIKISSRAHPRGSRPETPLEPVHEHRLDARDELRHFLRRHRQTKEKRTVGALLSCICRGTRTSASEIAKRLRCSNSAAKRAIRRIRDVWR